MGHLDLSLSTYALIGGNVITSNVLFGTLGISTMGALPILNGRFGDYGLRTKDKLNMFATFFKKGGAMTLASVWLNAFCSTIVAYNHPSPIVRKVSIASGVFLGLLLPFKPLLLGSINAEWQAIYDSNDLDTGAAGDENPRAKCTEQLLQMWEQRHNLRYILFVGGWVCALGALVMDNRV